VHWPVVVVVRRSVTYFLDFFMTTIRDRDHSDPSFSCDIFLEESSDCNLVFHMTANGDGHKPALLDVDWSYTIGISDPNNGYDEIVLSPDQLNDLVEAFQSPCLSFLSKEFRCDKRIRTNLVLQRDGELLKISIVDADDGSQVARTIVLTEQDVRTFVQAVDGSAAFQRDLHAMSKCPLRV
jgi:hypothetical protein